MNSWSPIVVLLTGPRGRDYNVIFRDEAGDATDAHLQAFEDTWHGPSAEATCAYRAMDSLNNWRAPDSPFRT